MNLVERFFRDLSQQAILPGSFGSVRQLVDAIMEYLAQHNLKPKRYVWKAKGEEILARSNEPESGPWRRQRCHYYLRDSRLVLDNAEPLADLMFGLPREDSRRERCFSRCQAARN